MGWREFLIRAIGPGMAVGMRFGDWVRILSDNGFRVHPSRLPKAACATIFSLVQTPIAWVEHLVYDHRIEGEPVLPPVFILGHWRNGTTHLHNLLSLDPRFAYPRVYQVVAPHTFLLCEPLVPLGSYSLPRSRFGVDNLALSAEVPAEDEAALCVMTGLSPVVGFAFPERADFYDRFLTFHNASLEEIGRWQSALLWFVKKLSWRYKRPLVLKSPAHTCRIRLILKVFPEARFVHIHRNPLVVYQSMRRLMDAVWGIYSFQKPPDQATVHARIIRQYRELYDVFFEERKLIPSGHYCEVGFEDLERDPLGELERIYQQLSLPDFGPIRPTVQEYLATLVGYQKNVHPELPSEVRTVIWQAWQRCFEEWGYSA